VFDVLVVGGGITGAAAARDAASRGLSVALVEKEDCGPVDQGPGECHALGLATGDLVRLAPLEAGQLDQLEHVGDARLHLGVLDLLATQAEGDVLLDREVGEQGVALEDRVDVALVGGQPGDILTLQLDQAAGRLLEPADHPEGGGLAAA